MSVFNDPCGELKIQFPGVEKFAHAHGKIHNEISKILFHFSDWPEQNSFSEDGCHQTVASTGHPAKSTSFQKAKESDLGEFRKKNRHLSVDDMVPLFDPPKGMGVKLLKSLLREGIPKRLHKN